jgi:hypothetical protein
MPEQRACLHIPPTTRDALSTTGYWFAWSLLFILSLTSDSFYIHDSFWLVPIGLWLTAYKISPVSDLEGASGLLATALAMTTLAWVLTESYFHLSNIAGAFSWSDEYRFTRLASIPTRTIFAATLAAILFSTLCVRSLGLGISCVLSGLLLIGSISTLWGMLLSYERWQNHTFANSIALIEATAPPTILFIGCCIANRYHERAAEYIRAQVPVTLRHFWGGESFRWLTTIVYCIAVAIVMRSTVWRINLPNQDLDALSANIGLTVSWGSNLTLLYFASVPAWRRCNSNGPCGRLARLGIVLLSLPFIAQTIFVEGPRIGMYLEPLAQHMIGSSSTIRSTDNPDELRIYGSIYFGFANDLKDALTKHPGVTRLVLSSDGGFVDEGADAADVIQSNALTTVVTDRCSSACSLLFVAGKVRILGSEGQIGFHGSRGPVSSVDDAYYNRAWAKHYVALGIDPEFTKRALNVPPNDMWYPTADELMAAGVITQREE